MTMTASMRAIAQACTSTRAPALRAATGYLLIYAAASFWISWFLMPDPGTTDAAHILAIVKEARTAVLWSMLIQITSAVSYLAALFLLVQTSSPQRTAMAGIVLFGVGAMGLCADAFFHLLAYEMTSDTVAIGDNVIRVMHLMQTEGVVILIPILLPFFAGGLVLAIGLGNQAATSRSPAYVLAAAFLVGILLGYQGRLVTLTSLALFSVGHAMIGVELAFSRPLLAPAPARDRVIA
jgi:hypothetical protein